MSDETPKDGSHSEEQEDSTQDSVEDAPPLLDNIEEESPSSDSPSTSIDKNGKTQTTDNSTSTNNKGNSELDWLYRIHVDFKEAEKRQWEDLKEVNTTASRYLPVLVLFTGAVAFFGRWLAVTCWPPSDKSVIWHIAIFTLMIVCLVISWAAIFYCLARHDLNHSYPQVPEALGESELPAFYIEQINAAQENFDNNSRRVNENRKILGRGQTAAFGSFILTLLLSCFYFFASCNDTGQPCQRAAPEPCLRDALEPCQRQEDLKETLIILNCPNYEHVNCFQVERMRRI